MCITEALITKRNLTFPEDEELSERMFHTLAELRTVRLDREGITTIKNLESLQNIHSLYLQANKIERIENLDCIPSLRFLSLAGNQIKQVENLRDLPHLQFLDLSENQIETLKLDEFPESILILNLMGNNCTKQDGYREQLTEALPLLLDLDRQPVSERWATDEEDESLSDEDEFPELGGPFCSEQGFFKEMEQQMMRRRERRQQGALTDHLLRMEMQPTLTSLPHLSRDTPSEGCSPFNTPSLEKQTTPSELLSSPPASSAPKEPSTEVPRAQPSTSQAKVTRAVTVPKAPLFGRSSATKVPTRKVKH